MNQDYPLISVIVPVYNVGGYLKKCLESLLAQTYPHMEVVVVDDASTDGSGAVCDAFAARDSRIRVLHLPINRGVSAARNQGIQAARGQFAAFVDSDDYVNPQLLERLYANLAETGSDISICGTVGLKLKDGPAAIYTREDVVGCLAQHRLFLWTVWGKLYSMELVKKIPFDQQVLSSEDLLVFFQLLQHVERVCYFPDPLYHYISRKGSLMNSGVDEKRCTVLAVLDHICQESALHFPELETGFRQIAMDTAARLAVQTVEEGAAGRRWDYLKRFRDHTRRHFSLNALALCPNKRSAVAQLALCAGAPVFWILAALSRRAKLQKRPASKME